MKKIFFAILALLFMIPAMNTFAQGCDDDAAEGEEDGAIKFFGFVQPQYEYHMTEPASNTFKFKRARIGIKGDIPYDFSYYVMMENSAFVSQTGSPYLLDAFITYKRFKWAKVSLGSFKQPFGLEVNTACHSLHTIDRAMVSDQIVAPQRDMGVMLLGGDKDSKFKYSLAMMNGRGLGTKDNNNMKDIIGRLVFKPLDFLSVGASFRHAYPNTNEDIRTSLGGDLEIKTEKFLIQGEYIYDEGDYNRAAGGGCGADPVTLGKKRSGAFVQAAYLTNFNLQPVVKWEYFDTDADIDDNNWYTYTFGLNYFFNDATRIQANYQYKVEKSADGSAETPNDAFLIQLQIKF